MDLDCSGYARLVLQPHLILKQPSLAKGPKNTLVQCGIILKNVILNLGLLPVFCVV